MIDLLGIAVIVFLMPRLVRRLLAGPLGGRLSALSCASVLRRVDQRRRLVAGGDRLLGESTRSVGEDLARHFGSVASGPSELLAVGLTDAGAETWLAAAGAESLTPTQRLRLRHEAELRGGEPTRDEPPGDEPLSVCQRALVAAESGAPAGDAYSWLERHADHLPLVSRVVLERRLAAATGDRELAAVARERALRQPVTDPAPEAVPAAWAALVEPLAATWRPAETPNVRAWKAAPAVRRTTPGGGRVRLDWGPPPPPGTFEIRLRQLSDLLGPLGAGQRDLAIGRMVVSGLAPTFLMAQVYHARPEPGDPEAAEHWRRLLEEIDRIEEPDHRAAALAAYGHLLRAALHKVIDAPIDTLGPDQHAYHRRVAMGIGEPVRRAVAMLDAAAVQAVLPGGGTRAYDEVVTGLTGEVSEEFWAAFLEHGGPLLCLVSDDHPQKPALLAAYLERRWLRRPAEPWSGEEGLPGGPRLEAVLRELTTAPLPPAGWLFRGVPDTDQALLDQALGLALAHLARRGAALLDERYRRTTTARLRAWAAR